jgi:hypothetical protein
MEIGLVNNIDFILFQEPYIRDSYSISHPAYNIILPENCIRPRVAIYLGLAMARGSTQMGHPLPISWRVMGRNSLPIVGNR